VPPERPISHRFVAPDGIGLAVHDWGGDGPPTLLAHPTGFHGMVWEPVAHRLVHAGRRVWSFDFRGHGDSDPSPDGHYSWDEFARDARAVADHLGISRHPHLVACGHSKGGASLIKGEIDAPGTYARIWAFEPIMFPSEEPLPPSPDNPLSIGARKRRAVWESREAAYGSYASKPPLSVLTPEALRAYVDHGFRDRADGTVELKCEPEAEARVYAMGAANGIFGRLGEVHAPVLVACGETTDAIVPKLAEMIVARLERGSLEVWPGIGHFGPMEDPEQTAESILRFASA
jgi:pimeloyl-ACP methyl ester carboxylesterase